MSSAANHVALNSKPEYCPPPLYMLCCNEATSVNCCEGWWLHRDDYYTLGSLCTRLFFLLLLLLPISFTLLMPNLPLNISTAQGIFRNVVDIFFFPSLHTNHSSLPNTLVPWVAFAISYWCYFSFVDCTDIICCLIEEKPFLVQYF